MKKTFNVVDMFCGAGGESTGIMQAAFERDLKVNLLAINHWELAIETHAANHPHANHLREDVERVDPTRVTKNKKIDLLWASPECTHHSIARGGRPRSEQSRASPWLICKWLSELYVSRVIIENVPEFLSWGPLDKNGKPLRSKKGETFRMFIAFLRSLGYTVDWTVLRAADYGTPTTRRRLFIQAVRGRKKIIWPQITHIDGRGGNLMGYKPWIPARDIIDWGISGQSIFDRKKPLADATIRRIAAGIEKYWGYYAEPFITKYQGDHDGKQDGDSRNHEIERPLPRVDTSNRYALVEPLIVEYYGNGGTEPVSGPLKTITTKDRFALLEPFILPNEGYYRGNKARSLDTPLNAVTSRGAGGIVEPFIFAIGQGSAKSRARSIDEPLSTIVTKQEHCLIQPGMYLDIKFRMLKNHELKKAQGFDGEYIIKGNVTEQTKQIGNAVPPPLAKALTKAILSA